MNNYFVIYRNQRPIHVATSKIKRFVTIIYSWKHSNTVAKRSILDKSKRLDPAIKNGFTVTVETVSIMNSFWIELDGFFCQTKINFTKLGPLPTSKMDLLVTIVVIFRLLERAAQMLTPWWMMRDSFSLLFQTQNKIRISMKLF